VEAVFVYEGRPDAPVSYGTGFSVTTARRLRAMAVMLMVVDHRLMTVRKVQRTRIRYNEEYIFISYTKS